MKLLNWIDCHMAEIMLIGIYFLATLPFFSKPHGFDHYVCLGGISGLLSYFMIDKNREMGRLCSVLIAGILIIGGSGFCLLHGIKSGEALTIPEQSLTCFVGALGGIMIAGFCESIVREDKKKEQDGKDNNKTKTP